MGRVFDTLFYGFPVGEGKLDESFEEYRDRIQGLEDVDVSVEGDYQSISYHGNPTTMDSVSFSETGLEGQEAWDFVDETLEERTGKGLEDLKIKYEHLNRFGRDKIIMGTVIEEPHGARWHYTATFKGNY